MITRYSRPEMRGIWTDENKLRIWLQIELLASEALVKEGIVPRNDFARIKRGADNWFADLPGLVARQKELEKILNHDVIGFTTAVAEKINHNASRWFHFGLTSSDVGDTCLCRANGSISRHSNQRRKDAAKIHRQTCAAIQIHALHRSQPRHPRRANHLRPEARAHV